VPQEWFLGNDPDEIVYGASHGAGIIARRAFGVADGREAKKQSYGFIKQTFRELKSGVKSWSEILVSR
jgi:hypothetical protein